MGKLVSLDILTTKPPSSISGGSSRPVYIDGVRATIKKWSVNHRLDRFGGHGTHYTSPYYCKLDQSGGTCIFKIRLCR
ncbi:hypothetical protein [Clostridium botulinum]|uniref:hypothetical protein n=1 Tax=Clostridium botulinum TaxID=1491 RepID=UPI00211B62B5|nr:hypothetical protein [Clostridium botulinum]